NPVETTLEKQQSNWAAKCLTQGKDGPFFALREPAGPRDLVRMQTKDKITVELMVKFSQGLGLKGQAMVFEYYRYTQSVGIVKDALVIQSTINRKGKPEKVKQKFPLNGEGMNSLGYFLDGWHHFVYQVDAKKGKAELWIDGKTSEQLQIRTQPGENLCQGTDCYLIYTMQRFQGDVKKINVYDQTLSATTIRQHYKDWIGKIASRSVPMVESSGTKGSIDPKEFAPGHPRVQMSGLSQLRVFPSPRYKPGHDLHRHFNWMELRFLAGMTQSYVQKNRLAQISTDLQEELINRWNYMLALQNVNIANHSAEWDKEKGCMRNWVDLANRYPQVPLSITTFQAQVKPIYKDQRRGAIVGLQNLPDTYYVKDAKGKFVLKDNRKVLSLVAPDELIRLDGDE
ncbi:MAG: hypothetical protein AAFR59_17150, partial [Bacteroidota bacterium]